MSDNAGWDVVIVGAGAGGAAAAYGLCQRGMSVLLLDAGPRFDPATDYPLTEADWEARDFPEKPGSTGTVTFAPGQKLVGNEPLLVSGSRGLGPMVTNGTRWMEKYHTSAASAAARCILPGVAPHSPRCDEDEKPFRRGCGLADRCAVVERIMCSRCPNCHQPG